MTLPFLHPITPKLNKRQLKKELKTLLDKYVRGSVPTQRYEVLIAAKRYAQQHHLELPEWVQPELTRAAQNTLQGYLEFIERST